MAHQGELPVGDASRARRGGKVSGSVIDRPKSLAGDVSVSENLGEQRGKSRWIFGKANTIDISLNSVNRRAAILTF